MPYLDIYIHFVFSTKNRYDYLDHPELRKMVWEHILVNARKKGIHVDMVNGFSDHCHCLVSLKNDQCTKEIMQLIKGESAFWINKNKLTRRKFAWQDSYWAASLSNDHLKNVRAYIKRQESHHQKTSFDQEIRIFEERFSLLK